MSKMTSQRLKHAIDAKAAFYLALVLHRVCLDYAYVQFVAARAWQAGFPLDVRPGWYAASWLTYILAATLIRRSNARPSNYFIAALYFIFFAPVTAFFGLTAASPAAFAIITAAIIALPLVASARDVPVPVISTRYFNGIGIAMLLTIITVAWLVANGGLQYFGFDLSEIYADRAETFDRFYRGPFAYLVVWAPKLFVSLILCHALLTRRYALVVAAIAVDLCFFAITKHRAILVYPVVLLFIFFHGRGFRTINLLPISLASMIVVSMVVLEATGTIYPASLFVRRALFVPAKDAFDYIAFFASNVHVYWSNSILESWLSYPYPAAPQQIIADARGSSGWVNNGFIANGYMHAGIGGVALYTLLCGMVLKILDSLSHRIPAWFATAVIAPALFSLLFSSDLLTALLTHGVGAGVALLALYRPPSQNQSDQ